MNKKANTALFILGATIFNILIMILLILGGLLIISLIFKNQEPGMGVQLSLFLVFALGIAGSFIIYNRVVKWIAGRIDLEKYFHPIIKPRKK